MQELRPEPSDLVFDQEASTHSRGSFLREMPAWGVSLAVHAILLLALASFTFAPKVKPEEVIVFSEQVEYVEPELQNLELAFANDSSDESMESSESDAIPEIEETPEEAEKEDQEEIEKTVEEDDPTIVIAEAVPLPNVQDLNKKIEGQGETVHAQGVSGAIDRLTFEIANSLKERPTLVIWMFDASQSLEKRRREVTARFDGVYRKLGVRDASKSNPLQTVVASFGSQLNLLTKQPVSDPKVLSRAVAKIKADKTGREFVFEGVKRLSNQFIKWEKKQKEDYNIMVVVVTDERGDDLRGHLESTIHLLRRNGVKCYCIGDEAIFGRRKGYVKYTWKEGSNTFTEDLPVDQGPETLLPQRLELSFWGGENRDIERMTANYGPYGLTRLCAETNGLYLVTKKNKKVNFDNDIMASYRPDYRPVRLIENSTSKNKAKMKLVEAARLSQKAELEQPQMTFRADNDNRLRQEITEAQKLFVVFDSQLEILQGILAQGERARGAVREPRWRASYDLAMGRVYAMRARAYGYNVVLANMKVSPRSFRSKKNNHWQLISSKNINGGISVKKLAERANYYLQRVRKEHSGTPWATLAEYEMRRPMGWDWKEKYVFIPKPVPRTANPKPNTPRVMPKPKPKPKARPVL